MTDEEKQAIEFFKKRMNICLENADICDENDFDEEAICLRKEQILIETVLNLIEKQQSELETLKRDFEIVDHECSRLEREDVRKDIIIDLMSEEIAGYNHYEALGELEEKEEVKQYFERKAEK